MIKSCPYRAHIFGCVLCWVPFCSSPPSRQTMRRSLAPLTTAARRRFTSSQPPTRSSPRQAERYGKGRVRFQILCVLWVDRIVGVEGGSRARRREEPREQSHPCGNGPDIHAHAYTPLFPHATSIVLRLATPSSCPYLIYSSFSRLLNSMSIHLVASASPCASPPGVGRS